MGADRLWEPIEEKKSKIPVVKARDLDDTYSDITTPVKTPTVVLPVAPVTTSLLPLPPINHSPHFRPSPVSHMSHGECPYT